MADKVTITHEVTEDRVTTTVTLPDEEPISKSWVRIEHGRKAEFDEDWDEDRRLFGWESVAAAAMEIPDLL